MKTDYLNDTNEKKENNEIKRKNKNNSQNENSTKKESFYKKALKNLQEYGLKGLVVYYALYLAGLGIIYYLIENKYMDVNNELVKKLIDIDDKRKKYGENIINFVIAYFLNGFVDLVRIPFVVLILRKMIKK